MKTYYENQILVADLSEEQKQQIMEIEPQPHFVSGDMVEKINHILNLKEQETEEELRAIRNSMVILFSKEDFKDADGHFNEDAMCRMSMVTAVIDHIKWEKGFPV